MKDVRDKLRARVGVKHNHHRLKDIPTKPLGTWREQPLAHLDYAWTAFRWRLAVITVLHPVGVAVAVAFVICAYPLYAVLEQQGTLRDNQDQLQRYARENRKAINDLRALTLRVTKIEHPTPAELRRAIAHALVNCGHNPRCRVLFGRLTKQARRELRRQARRRDQRLQQGGVGSATGGGRPHGGNGGRRSGGGGTGPRSSSPPRSPGANAPPSAPSSPVPTPPPAPSPRPTPRPPVSVTVPGPVQTPPLCTPLINVNCR